MVEIKDGGDGMLDIKMRVEDLTTLLVGLGFATAAIRESGPPEMYAKFVHLINAVGKNDPHFVPY
jgi:hypothetical protein